MAKDFLGTLAAVNPQDWGALGMGLLSSPNWQSGLAAGVQGVQQNRAGRAAAERQAEQDAIAKQQFETQQETADLTQQKLQQELDTGQWIKLGPNSLYNTVTKETKYADPAMVAKFKTANATVKSPEFKTDPPVYDGQGNMWFPTTNKSSGETVWEGPDGVQLTHPPPGATRPQDSLYGELGKMGKQYLSNLGEEADKARGSLQSAERSLALLADPDVWTGFGAEIVTDLKSAMVSTGFASQETVDSVAKMDEFRKLSFEFVMQQVAGTKGAVSDREMDLFAKASPGLAKTKQGNQRILEGIKMISERKLAQRRFMNRQMIEKGMPAYLAEEKWDDYIEENPLFTKDWFKVEPETPEPTTGGETATMPGYREPATGTRTTEDLLNEFAPVQ